MCSPVERGDLGGKPSGWRQWLKQPQSLWLHNVFFQIHFWIGAVAGLCLALMSVTGSVIVYRDELSRLTSVGWIVKLHTNLLLGSTAVSDRSPHMVARSEELASQSYRELGGAISAHQLGPA